VATRTFSFRAQQDFAERHERALRELDRLREEQPLLADSIRYDFDVRLLEAQRRGLDTPAQRLHATIAALIEAVEGALPDEPYLGGERAVDEESLAGAHAAAEAVARRYESDARTRT
jgi:hypothetical protein